MEKDKNKQSTMGSCPFSQEELQILGECVANAQVHVKNAPKLLALIEKIKAMFIEQSNTNKTT